MESHAACCRGISPRIDCLGESLRVSAGEAQRTSRHGGADPRCILQNDSAFATRSSAEWVPCDQGAVADVAVRLTSPREAERVGTDEAAQTRVVVAGPVVVQARLGVKLAARER